MKRINKTAVWGGGAVTVAAATAVWTAMAALPGGAYSTKAPFGLGLPSSTPVAAAPVSSSAAVHEAVAMQTAFNDVARSAAPAVVTITTMENIPTRSNFGGMPFRFGMPGGRGGMGGQDPFNDFLRQFNQGGNGGNGSEGDGGPNMQQNDFSDGQPSGGGHEVRAGLGSGFIIRKDGLILTNAHVVRGADRVTVKLSDGREFKNAKVLGQDDRTDVAVVKIPADNLPTLTLGDSDQVNVGDWSIAVGNPFGFDHTVTVGVISAKGRDVPDEGGVNSHLGSYLQTDASINPGNSGGPLLDIYGRVVGINNSIYTGGSGGGSVGIGFAVPIDTARQIADVLVRDGRVRRAKLGVAITDVASEASAFGLDPNTKGVLVEGVEPNSPAAAAGIQPGDVVTAVNGQNMTKSSELQNLVSTTPVGTPVTLDILRAGKHQTVTAKVEELKDGSAANTANGSGNDNGTPQPAGALGVRVQPLTADIASQLGLNPTLRGVVVASVTNGSLAAQSGIQPGDVIERVGQTPVATPAELKAAVTAILGREAADSKSVALLINRRGNEQYHIVGDAQ